PLVFVRGHPVHARGPVLASAPVRFPHPVHVHQVGQRGERHLRRLSRQRGYPLLFRGHDGRISMHSSCFSRGTHDLTPRFPPLAPVGTVRQLHRYYQGAMTSGRPSRRTSLPSLGGTSASTRSLRSPAAECTVGAWSC